MFQVVKNLIHLLYYIIFPLFLETFEILQSIKLFLQLLLQNHLSLFHKIVELKLLFFLQNLMTSFHFALHLKLHFLIFLMISMFLLKNFQNHMLDLKILMNLDIPETLIILLFLFFHFYNFLLYLIFLLNHLKTMDLLLYEYFL